MPANVFFDTSVLIYALKESDPRAVVTERLLVSGGFLSVQVLNEFVCVARRKLGMSWLSVMQAVEQIRALCETPLPLTLDMHEHGLAIAQRFRYHIYDSLVIAAAIESGCSVLYSEDMQGGQVIESLHIRNPFATR